IRVSSPWLGGGAGAEPPVDLRVTGNASPNPTVAGTQVTYTLDIANAATREASGVRVRVTLPAGATPGSFNPAPISNAGGVLTFDAWRVRGGGVGQDRLASGATGTITFNVSGLTTGVSELPVVVSSTEDDADLADNSIVVTARINAAMCALPVSGRTAWWPGDGTPLNYGSGPAYHATPVGNVSYGPGAVGQAFVLDGATGYLKVPNGWPEQYWPGTGATSVAAWFATQGGGATQVIASMDDMAHAPCCGSPQGHAAWYLYVQDGVVKASMRQSPYGSAGVVIIGTTPVTDGQFHHAALVIDIPALQARLYVNGALEASAPLASGWTMSWGDYEAEELVIGASQVLWGTGYRNFFNGAIDDVALYKRVLTATEIANAAAGARLAECGAVPVILESPGDQSGEEGDAVSLVLNAAVGEGRVAQFEAVGLPPGLSIGMHDGVIAGTIAEGVAGTYPVTVRLSDSLTEATVSFLWTVTVPPVPVLTLRAGAGAILTVLETGAQCLGGDANGMFDRTCAIEVPAGTYTVQGTTSLSMSRLRWHWTFAVPHEVPAEADRVTVQVVDAADVGGALLGTFVVDRVWEAGGGPGTVTSSLPPYLDGEPGFGCGAGAKCVGQALLGTTVTLTAGRAGDHIFESWGGGCEGTDPVCQLYIDPLIYVRELSTPLAHAHFTVYQPPHLANPGGQQSYEGETISLPLTWSAGDARNVAFMATGLPPGLVIGQSTGVISGTLTMESSGTFQVTVTISDGERDWPSTFWWVVDDMNQDPVAVDDALEIDRNTPTFTIPAAQLLANDSDPDGDDLFIIAVGGSTNGLAVLRQDGNVDFTVNPVFHGTASFVYDVSDGRGGSAPANVVITVVLVNDDPIAVDDTAVTLGGAVTIEVLANDSDPDGDPVTITGIAVAPAKGSATIDGSSIIYTPTSMVYDGADTFTYAIEDGQGGTASATVTIATPPGELVDVSVAIVGVERDPDTGIPYVRMRVRNDGPATEPMVRFTAFSEVWLGMMQAVRLLEPAPGAACDPAPEVPLSHGIGAGACTIADMAPGAEVSIAVFVHPWTTSSPRTLPVSGRVRLDRIDADYSNNLVHEAVTIPLSVSDMSVSLSALPTSYRIGEPVTFTVEVRNAGPDVSVSRPLTLTLDGTGTSPFGCPAGAVTEGRSAWHCRVPSLEVGAVWTTSFEHVSSVAGTRASTARLFVTASEVYYTTDPDVANNEVSIDTIASENRTPVAVDDNRETDEDTPLEIAPATLLANDTDADGDTLTLVAVSDTAVNGTVTFEAGVIVFTPAPDFHGAASFQYQVSDGYDATAWGTVHITVHSVNDEPAVPDQLVNAVSGVPLTVAIGATDVDGDKL
ncbi:MAG: Ig-like domain-containing protein, partial [Acidobacteriota bacterium]|nr:Ig-like domain-containing protein [Acidobacteriota bacterium]